MRNIIASFVIVSLLLPVKCFEENNIYGIAYIALTVRDLDKSIRFYTEVLGGKLIEEFRGRYIQGNDHYYRMFQKEILDARSRGVSPESIGVPSIHNGGQHWVNWDFVLFDNSLLWLLQFADYYGNPVTFNDLEKGSAKYGYGHMAFWVSNSINPYQMIEEIYEGQKAIGSPYTGFSSVEDENSFYERNQKISTNIDKFVSPENDGFRIAATLGPDGEKIEFSLRRGKGVTPQYQSFCRTGAVHTSMLKNYNVENKYKKGNIKLDGLHHISITVPDTQQAVDFYTSVIGAKPFFVFNKSQFDRPFRNMVLQDDILAASQDRQPLTPDYGFVDVESGDIYSGTLDVSFMNMDNYFLETYTFHPVNSYDSPRLQRRNTSPAYNNRIHPGFWVKENIGMADFVKVMEIRALERGWSNVKANRAIDVSRLGDTVSDYDYSRPMTIGALSGFDYVFAKGPGGEQFSLAKFVGKSREVLEKHMKEYGSVSTAFPETNPYTWGGYDTICQQVTGQPLPERTTKPPVPSTRVETRPTQRVYN